MNALGTALDAASTSPALVVGAVVIAVPLLALLALLGHVAMKPVRKTRVGQWATLRADAHMDAYAARKSAKAGAS